MGRGAVDDGKKSAETAAISLRRLQLARQIGNHKRDLLFAVREGSVSPDDAPAERYLRRGRRKGR
jgi:hypothetical protein